MKLLICFKCFAESAERRQSLNSTTLEEVLDSLLALPSSSQSPSPSGYRAPKWETDDIDDPGTGGRIVTIKSTASDHDAKSHVDIPSVIDTRDAAAPMRLSLEGNTRTRSSGSDAGSSHSSMVSSSSSSSSSGHSHQAHDDDSIDRGSFSSSSSGTDRLTTGTTMTTSSNTSGISRVSDYASSSDAASSSGQSPRSSVSSSSVSGSGKEVIPPPPDFMDRSSEVYGGSPSLPFPFPGLPSAQPPIAESFEVHTEITDKTAVTTHQHYHQAHGTPTRLQEDSFPTVMLCTAMVPEMSTVMVPEMSKQSTACTYSDYSGEGEGMDPENNLQNGRKRSFPSPPIVEPIQELKSLHYDYEFTAGVPDSSNLDSNLGDSQLSGPLKKLYEVESDDYDNKSTDIEVGVVIDRGSKLARVDTEHVLSEPCDGPDVLRNYSPSVGTRFSPTTTLQETTVSLDDDHQTDELIQLTTPSIDVDDDDKTATAITSTTVTTKDRKIIRADLLDDTVIVKCSHDQCTNSAELRDARKTFKTCHNCYTYYCSRECRKDHWMRHRRVCMYGRIRSMCKQAIQCSRDNPNVLLYLSKLAQTGYITQGRGFVKMVFRNTDLAIRFLRQGWSQLEDGPIYVNWRDLIPQEMGDEVYRAVVDLCQRYEPDTKLVLLVAIFITREVPIQSVPHWEREVIAKCAKIPLSKLAISNKLDGHGIINDDPNTLIITGPQQIKGADVAAAKKTREVCLANIEEQLRERGVSLRHQFPDIYGRLCSYVDNDDPFPPLTIYPKDGRTGHTFMCVIMPNSGAPPLHDWLKMKAK